MKILMIGLFFMSLNACAASNGGGWVVGNPVMPAGEGKEAVKFMDKKDCVCKDPKATPPCECKVEEKKEKAPDVKPVVKPSKKKAE
jgi:hypothetical protein